MRGIYINRDGVVVTEDEAHDEKGHLRDGYGYRTTMILTDGAPRFFVRDAAADTEREKLIDAYEARDARLANAWRDPQPAAKIPATDGDRIAAYERRDQRLRDAWRHSI